MNRKIRSSWYLSICLGLLTIPHIGGAGELVDETTGLRAALVPGADFIIRVDLEALGKAPVYETTHSLFDAKLDLVFYEAQVRFPFISEAVMALQDSMDRVSQMRPQLAAATGLMADDMIRILISADLSSTGPDPASLLPPLRQMDFVVAIALDKPLEKSKLKEALQLLINAAGGGTLWDAQAAGTEGFQIVLPDIRFFIGASRDLQTVYVTLNSQSLAGAIGRERSGQTEKLSPSLSKANNLLPGNAQVRVLLAVTDPMRQRLRGMGTSQQQPNPASATGGNFGACFQTLQTLSLGVTYDTEVRALLASRLEGEQEAKQAAAILQAVAVPVLQKNLMDWTGGSPTALEAAKAECNETTLSLSLRFTPENLERILNQP